MSARTATRLAWSLWVACLALIAFALLLDFLRTEAFLAAPLHMLSNHRFVYPIYAVLTGMLSLVYPTIGALIVSRLPRNPIGWIFCGVGLLYQLHHFAFEPYLPVDMLLVSETDKWIIRHEEPGFQLSSP
jgi:membrane protease YdiL (CAAX protease family)